MTTKDAYWFSHDSNAKDDPKIMLLIDQLGLEGYGIYWVLVETLREQPNYRYPIKMIPILAKRYYTSGEKMAAVVNNYELFAIEQETFFFSPSLDRRMLGLENRREQARLAGIASAEKRRQLALNNARSTDVQQQFNSSSTSRVEESRVKDNKKEVIHDEIINELYKAYPTKCPIKKRSLGKSASDKKRIQKLLTKHTKEDLLFRIEAYVADCAKNKIFLKDFSTFLNNLPDIDANTKNKKEMPEAFIYDENGLGVKNPEYTKWQKQQV